jgi:hypothetical protein
MQEVGAAFGRTGITHQIYQLLYYRLDAAILMMAATFEKLE